LRRVLKNFAQRPRVACFALEGNQAIDVILRYIKFICRSFVPRV